LLVDILLFDIQELDFLVYGVFCCCFVCSLALFISTDDADHLLVASCWIIRTAVGVEFQNVKRYMS